MDADKIVRDFCEAWGRADLEAIVGAFTDDAVYHNIPMAPCEGREQIRTFIGGLFGGMVSAVHFDIRKQLVAGTTVMNERIDTLVMADRKVVLPVCGVFELTAEGKIRAWRDYFDAAQFAGRGMPMVESGQRRRVTTEADLRTIMPEPKARVVAKKIHRFEEASRFFIDHTACVGITTARPGGGAVVSARIGKPGFLHVASDHTIWIPDTEEGRVGPSAEAIGESGFAGLIFLVRGIRDTLRANGRATLAEGDALPAPVRELADRAIRIDIDEAFLHCPKAFLRSRLWDPAQSTESASQADVAALEPTESAFLAESPFVLLGTHGPNGAGDLSPRGDPAGFVRQIGPGALLLPDRPGNHLADSLRNVLATEAVGLLALVPGRAEALAISGRAELWTGDDVWSGSSVKSKVPELGFRIEVLDAELHRAPALDEFWSADDRVDPKTFPTLGQLLLTQLDPNGRGKRVKAWALDTSLRRDEKVNLY